MCHISFSQPIVYHGLTLGAFNVEILHVFVITPAIMATPFSVLISGCFLSYIGFVFSSFLWLPLVSVYSRVFV